MGTDEVKRGLFERAKVALPFRAGAAILLVFGWPFGVPFLPVVTPEVKIAAFYTLAALGGAGSLGVAFHDGLRDRGASAAKQPKEENF